MALRSNKHYWEFSLNHPEPVGEVYYRRDEIIINDEAFLAKVAELRELVSTYCTLRNLEVDAPLLNKVLASIDSLLMNTSNIQYTEFVAYWKCLDLTFSVYKSIADESQRHEMLRQALDAYCGQGRTLYDRLGYSHIVQQALYDSAKSRTQGTSGLQKLQDILQQSVGTLPEAHTIEEFETATACWFVPSTDQHDSFLQLMRGLEANYPFGQAHQKKIPDLVVKLGNVVLVIEAKHIKEPGGAQDKQIGELIRFVSQREPRKSPVRYVAFLDGLYFNILAQSQGDTKAVQQRRAIEAALRKNRRNYFVNTAGLVHLLQDAVQARSAGG